MGLLTVVTQNVLQQQIDKEFRDQLKVILKRDPESEMAKEELDRELNKGG
jgi:hypothetical protein